MLEDFLKDKKKTGICIVTVIVIIAAGVLYGKSGYKELMKNDNEAIFVDDNDEVSSISNKEISSKEASQEKSVSSTKIEPKEKNITVEIKGEVKKPDVYILKENSIVKDLIDEAGGLTENADIANINRAKQLQNHELVYIGSKNESTQSSAQPCISQSSSMSTNAQPMVNINSATAEELKSLNGIGDAKAKSIIEYRDKNGGFKSIEDIKNVDGIGDKMFEKIKDSITV